MVWADWCREELKQTKPSDAFVTFIYGLNPSNLIQIPMNCENLNTHKHAELLTTILEHAEISKADSTYHSYAQIDSMVLDLVVKDTRSWTGRGHN